MGSQDVRIAEYQRRLREMVLADVDPKQPFEAQQKEADSIMTRLLGAEWKNYSDSKQEPGEPPEDFMLRLDRVGDDYGLGRAPGVEPEVIKPELPYEEKPEKDTLSVLKNFVATLNDLLNKDK